MTTRSKMWRRISLSRNRFSRFSEKVEWWGTEAAQRPDPAPSAQSGRANHKAREAAITRVETRITASRGISREECTGNAAQYQLSVFNFART
jgi:hypothetical protein